MSIIGQVNQKKVINAQDIWNERNVFEDDCLIAPLALFSLLFDPVLLFDFVLLNLTAPVLLLDPVLLNLTAPVLLFDPVLLNLTVHVLPFDPVLLNLKALT